MISIAIIGILLMVAVPVYLDYAVRARVSEGLVLVGDAKVKVGDNAYAAQAFGTDFITRANWNDPPSRCDTTQDFCTNAIGAPDGNQGSENVQSIRLNNANGAIVVEFTSKVAPDGANTLTIVPTAGGELLTVGTVPQFPVIWHCFAQDRPAVGAAQPISSDDATLRAQLAPSNCRG